VNATVRGRNTLIRLVNPVFALLLLLLGVNACCHETASSPRTASRAETIAAGTPSIQDFSAYLRAGVTPGDIRKQFGDPDKFEAGGMFDRLTYDLADGSQIQFYWHIPKAEATHFRKDGTIIRKYDLYRKRR
jgi:hypothetical protein